MSGKGDYFRFNLFRRNSKIEMEVCLKKNRWDRILMYIYFLWLEVTLFVKRFPSCSNQAVSMWTFIIVGWLTTYHCPTSFNLICTYVCISTGFMLTYIWVFVFVVPTVCAQSYVRMCQYPPFTLAYDLWLQYFGQWHLTVSRMPALLLLLIIP